MRENKARCTRRGVEKEKEKKVEKIGKTESKGEPCTLLERRRKKRRY
jgi:hypothetical protein